MAEIKTKKNNASVTDFIKTVEDEQKRKDAHELVKIFESITQEKAMMRGTSIIGFGQYHYKSEKSRQEWDRPLIWFSPRKTNMTIYVMPGFDKYAETLGSLWKHKTSKWCLYFKRLTDINMSALNKLIAAAFNDMKKKYCI